MTESTNGSLENEHSPAEKKLGQKLANALAHASTNGRPIRVPDVTLNVIAQQDDFNQEGTEILSIEVGSRQISKQPLDSYEKFVKPVLQQSHTLSSHVQFESEKKETANTKDSLKEVIAAGADIPTKIPESPVLDPKEDQGFTFRDGHNNTTNVLSVDTGITIDFNLTSQVRKHFKNEDIKKHFEAHKDELLGHIADRVIKYKNARGNKEEAKIRAAIKALHFEVQTGSDHLSYDGEAVKPGYFSISLMSDQQKQKAEERKAEKKHLPFSDAEDAALKKTNILNDLDPLQLSKAINRSVLMTAPESDITIGIMSAKDMYRLIEKQLIKFKTQKPEFKEKVDAILTSSVFADPYAKKDKHESKEKIKLTSNPSNGNLVVNLQLPKNEASKFIDEMEAMEVSEIIPNPKEAQKFASVDKLELVGIHSQNPSVHQELQKLSAPLAGQSVPAQKAETFAENIIKLIEQAYQQVQDGKKALAQQADQKFEQQLAQSTGSESHGKPEAVLTPSSIATNRHPQLDVNNLNWAQKLAVIAGQSDGMHLGA